MSPGSSIGGTEEAAAALIVVVGAMVGFKVARSHDFLAIFLVIFDTIKAGNGEITVPKGSIA